MQKRNPQAGWWTDAQSGRPEPEVLTILFAKKRLGKTFKRVNGKWKELARPFAHEFGALEQPFQGIAELSSLIHRLVTDKSFVKRSLAQGFVASHVDKIGPFRRIRTNFRDSPRKTWILDFDGVPLPKQFRRADVPAEWWVGEQFPQICNWLLAAVLPEPFHRAGAVFYATAKCGLIEHDKIRVRGLFILEKARTLAEQKAATVWLNTCLRERSQECAGMEKPPLDEGIYTPEHLVFTTRPELIGEKHDPIADPVVHTLDDREVELPDEVFAGAGDSEALGAKASSSSPPRRHGVVAVLGPRKRGEGQHGMPWNLQTASVETMLSLVTDGDTFQPVFNCVLSVLKQNPESVWDDKLEDLRGRLTERLAEISDDPDKLEERTRQYLSDERWNGIVSRARRVVFKGLEGSVETAPLEPQKLVHGHILAKDAVATLRREVRAWIEIIKGNAGKMVKKTPRVFLNATTGLGKSHVTIEVLISDPSFLRDHRVEYLVTTDKLSGELLEHAQKVPGAQRCLLRQHRGRSQEGMCLSEEYGPIAEEFEKLGLSPINSVCKRCDRQAGCKWFDQHQDVSEAGLVFSTHANLGAKIANRKIREVENRVHILDESPFNEAFERHLISSQHMEVSGQLAHAVRKLESAHQGLELVAHLMHSRQCLCALLASAGSTETGRVSTGEARKAFNRVQAEVGDPVDLEERATRAIRQQLHIALESRVAEGKTTPHQTKQIELFRRELDHAAAARAFWKMVKASTFAPGRQTVAGVRVWEGEDIQAKVTILKVFPEIVRALPFLSLDATGSEVLLKGVLPAPSSADELIKLVHPYTIKIRDIEAQRRSYYLEQVIDKPYGLSGNLPADWIGASGKQRKPKKSRPNASHRLAKLFAFVGHEAGLFGQVGLIGQKSFVEAMRELGLPSNVEVLNFGALRGRNHLQNADRIIIIGRAVPSMQEIEDHTEALHAEDKDFAGVIEIAKDRYAEGSKKVLLADGTVEHFQGERHQDPRAEHVRWLIAGAEVEQAIGRARLVHRDKPVKITVFGQEELLTPVHRLTRFREVEVSREQALAVQPVLFRKGNSLVRAFPALLPTDAKSRKKIAAEAWEIAQGLGGVHKTGQSPYKDIYTGECPDLCTTADNWRAPLPLPRQWVQFRRASTLGRAATVEDALIPASNTTELQARDVIASALRLHSEAVEFVAWGSARVRSKRHKSNL